MKKINWVVAAQMAVVLALAGMSLVFAFGPSHAVAQTSPVLRTLPCDSSAGFRCGNNTFTQLLHDVINIMLAVAGGIAVLFLIIGGYRYIMSGGNEESAAAGKSTIVNALIGLAVIILAYVIVSVVVNLVSGSGTSGV